MKCHGNDRLPLEKATSKEEKKLFFLSIPNYHSIYKDSSELKKYGNFQSCFSYMSFNAPKSKVLDNTDWNS